MSENDFEVRILERHDYSFWDDLVAQSPQGTVFHNSNYLQVVAEAISSKLNFYGCFKDDELVGGCSLFIKKLRGIITQAASNGPLTPYGGFLLPKLNGAKVRQSELAQNGILNALCDSIQRGHYSSISITNSPDLLDIRPCIWRGWEGNVAYTYYIFIDGSFLNRFSKSVQREIKKASNSGFYIERFEDATLHFNLLTQVFERQNQASPVGENFFKMILDVIEKKKCGGMWVAKDKAGDVVASRIWIWDEKRAYAWSAASDPALRDSGANQFLFAGVLKEMQKMGLNQVNIMHGNTQRLSYYAAGYNPTLVPYYFVTKKGFLHSIVSDFKTVKGNHI